MMLDPYYVQAMLVHAYRERLWEWAAYGAWTLIVIVAAIPVIHFWRNRRK